MIDTILFDLDNTLFDFNKAEKIAAKKTLLHLDIEPKQEILARYSQLNLEQWKLLEQGKLNRKQVKIRRYQLLFEELGVSRSAEQAAKIYESFLKIGHYYVEGAEELLQELCGDHRLYLVTNGTAIVQKSRIKSANLEQYFNGIFISEEVGFDKPSRKYFEFCFKNIPNFKRDSSIIVGDSLTSDIQGGKNAGIKTVWFNPTHSPNQTEIFPDFEIEQLCQVKSLLK